MIIIEYKDFTIYQLYDREKDKIIISSSVRLNEENMLTFSLNEKKANSSIEPINEDFSIELINEDSSIEFIDEDLLIKTT